jgi:hypothetical protein
LPQDFDASFDLLSHPQTDEVHAIYGSFASFTDSDDAGNDSIFNEFSSELDPTLFGFPVDLLASLSPYGDSQLCMSEPCLQSSAQRSPEAEPIITTVNYGTGSLQKKRKRVIEAGSYGCHYCAAAFAVPSELKYVCSMGLLTNFFPFKFS